ncbi:MAG: ABC-F family ATP-binding cassette domain-containing protein, partial [Acidaminococcaceae bacterium]|nr:ABC-F family ATP-binding cassette domain-containing protein [Acidaminococcaceae bacterium]
LLPEDGKVEWPGKVTVGYLDQQTSLQAGMTIREVLRTAFDHMFAAEQQMLELYEKMGAAEGTELDKMMTQVGEIQSDLEHAGFYEIDTKIEEAATGLGLADIGLDKDVDNLSGGQRSKVLLTKLLLENDNILLLDEPTNYLDENHIEWLTTFLQNYDNAFILISHDTEFLNKVVNIIYHLDNCQLTRYSGDYNKFLELSAIYKAQQAGAYARQQQEVAQLEDFIARNKARISTTGRAKSRQKRLDKMEMLEKPKEKLKPTFRFKEARTPGRYLVEATDLVLGYDAPLTRPVSFKLERGQKVAVKGVNGLGKTTLLKTILGQIKPLSGTVELGEFLEPGYFAQEEREKNDDTALDDVWNEYPGMSNYEVRAALAACGLTNEHITSKVFVLSGGEAAKVRLCKLMLKNINWLILDEPTNHLDVEAKEELKRALIAFKGSILLVSHDPEFYSDWVTDVMNIEDWTTKIL